MASVTPDLRLSCGSVAEWLGCWTCDQQVAGSNPSLAAVESNPGQVVNTHYQFASVTKQYNLVPANGRWCLAAGKVTVGLASHWPRVTDISGSPPTGSRPGRGRWAPAYALLWSMVDFSYLSSYCHMHPSNSEKTTKSTIANVNNCKITNTARKVTIEKQFHIILLLVHNRS